MSVSIKKPHKKKSETEYHEKISPTAIGVAYARTFSDIPYSREIAELCGVDHLTKANEEVHRKAAPYFEARFKSLTNLLKREAVKNILEVAAGVGPRGLIMTSEDPQLYYIETDLTEMSHTKNSILAALEQQLEVQRPKNLHLASLDGFDRDAMATIVEKFPLGPITIAHEGLLAYYSRVEKQQFGQVVREMLLRRGGSWITPDFLTVEDIGKVNSRFSAADEIYQEGLQEIRTTTGRDFWSNAFVDLDDAKAFVTSMDFNFSIETIGEAGGYTWPSEMGRDDVDVRRQLSTFIWRLVPHE